MSNSTLATVKVPAYEGNYTKGRSTSIGKITVHHMAGVLTAKRCGELFQAVGRQGSSHYGIGNDGVIGQYVDEANTAWTDSNWESNCKSVTIEVSNSTTGGDWPVSNKALDSLVKLVADIAKRNNLGTLVVGRNLTWHQMYAATACPGNYLISKMNYIAEKANELNKPKAVKEVKVNGINIQREANYLVLYVGKSSTGTNQWGTEVAFNSKGVATCDPVYGVGNMKIPSGGYVLSGHNKASTWIRANIKKGDKLNIDVSPK